MVQLVDLDTKYSAKPPKAAFGSNLADLVKSNTKEAQKLQQSTGSLSQTKQPSSGKDDMPKQQSKAKKPR
jgi:hypothetical protein